MGDKRKKLLALLHKTNRLVQLEIESHMDDLSKENTKKFDIALLELIEICIELRKRKY